jgi:2-polyprenyl-3-methyl-5-hydroxy-6-metoxy-1,4-benzoquinol methylase
MTQSELQRITSEKSIEVYDPSGPRATTVREIFKQMPAKRKILDVGCATGAIMKPLVGLHEIHGVDICEPYVQQAVKAGIIAVPHDLDAGPLPYADKTFDAVFCGETIEHYVDTEWLMSEINRVLKPGGILVITFPNVRTVLGLAMLLFLDVPPMYAARYRSSHVRDFTLRTIKMAFKYNGFSVDRCVGTSFYLPKIGEFWSGVARYFPSWANTPLVVGTKLKDVPYNSDTAVAELDLS